MSNKRAISVVILLVVIVNLIFGIRWFIVSRSTSSSNACVNNLRQISGCKEQWALENSKTTNDVPVWEDIRPYLPRNLVCPQGGTYACGRVGDPPTCSLGGRDHALPAN
jgi:hypothetical protein